MICFKGFDIREDWSFEASKNQNYIINSNKYIFIQKYVNITMNIFLFLLFTQIYFSKLRRFEVNFEFKNFGILSLAS